MKYIFSIGTALFLASPAFCGQDKPDWLTGESAAYPRSAYVTGVGEGSSQEKAADKARAEVAKALGVSLSATTRSAMTETLENSSQEVSDEVKTATNKVLDGVEVVSYWEGPQSWYAFAVLNREHSLKVLKDKLDEIDRSWQDLAQELAKVQGKFSRLKLALRLLKLSKQRDRVNRDLRVLNPQGQGIPAPASAAEILSQARHAVSTVTVSVEAKGENARRLSSRIMDALSSAGFKAVAKGPKPADIALAAELESEAVPPENFIWYWARGSVRVQLAYGVSGEVFSEFEETGEESSRSPSSALDATLSTLAKQTAGHAFLVITSTELSDEKP